MKESNKIKEFFSEGNDMETVDNTLKNWVTRTMDGELRNKMAEKLNNEYGIKRKTNRTFLLRHIRPILALAASFALLFTLYFVNQDNPSANTLAARYLDAQVLQHPGNFKGVSEVNTHRIQGIMAFNNGDFEKAIIQFGKIPEPNTEDSHYLGLAHLKNGQYQEAIENLKLGTAESSRFLQEANWFLSLAYLLNGQDAAAKKQLEQIEEDTWKFDQAQELLKKLEN